MDLRVAKSNLSRQSVSHTLLPPGLAADSVPPAGKLGTDVARFLPLYGVPVAGFWSGALGLEDVPCEATGE